MGENAYATQRPIINAFMKIQQVKALQRGLMLTWADGSSNELPYIWLRDNDPLELHPRTHERVFDLTSVELTIEPEEFSADAEGLRIRWPDKDDLSRYDATWLYDHRPGRRRDDPARISKVSWVSAGITSIPRFDAGSCQHEGNELLRALQSLKTTGIILIENLDDDLDAGKRFGDLIGFKRRSNYGVMFDVQSKPDPNNLAYTSLALPLHTDLAYQEAVPGNQFLHCFRNETSGGESIFADALSIVEEFERDHPQDYQLLCRLNVPFVFTDDEHDIRYRRPVIGLDGDGQFIGLTFNAHIADVPDFSPEIMYDFYTAFRELMLRIRSAENNIEYALRSGEMVVFDNQRILHGRAAFEPDSGQRHLRGYYIEHNEIDNRIRMLTKTAA